MTSSVVVVRHGTTEWSRAGRHTGRTDVDLDAEGRGQAVRLRDRLSGWSFALVLSSPRRRAMETCQLAGFGEAVQVVDELREWDYGAYEGLTLAEILRADPGWVLWRDGCPGGESPEEVRSRCDAVLGRLSEVDGNVLVFAHGHLLRALAARWLGVGLDFGAHLGLDTASISVLGFEHECPAIRRWNVGG